MTEFTSIKETLSKIISKKISIKELNEIFIKRIKEKENLNIFIYFDEDKINEQVKEIEKLPNNKKSEKTPSVKIQDIDMPFGSMVSFMIKWALASIPAIMILSIIGIIISIIMISIFGSIMMCVFSFT